MKISQLKGIGPKRQQELEKIGLYTTSDLRTHFPHSYQDRSRIVRIADAVPGSICFMEVTVLRIRSWKPSGRGRKMTEITVTDGTGNMKLIFFVSSYFLNNLQVGLVCRVFGKVEQNGSVLQMNHPDISSAEELQEDPILPVYQTGKGISQNQMRGMVKTALRELDGSRDFIPEWIRTGRKLAGHQYALENIHFPASRKAWAAARYRLVYEELLLFQCGLQMLRGHREREARMLQGIAFPHDDYVRIFADSLEYELTGAQKRVIEEIEADMESDRQMERLLQGDVGSGKTAVAAAVLFKAVKDGCQGALMAPTDLLAEQHYQKFCDLFEPFGIRVGHLSGSLKKSEKDRIKAELAEGTIDLVVGTHALIQPDVTFCNLGLVVTDEQHRFGVNQRIAFSGKGISPDILVMTATPIPRSLAVVLFGDLSISVIDELPAGRKPIETRIIHQKTRKKLYHRIGGMALKGHQVYVVAPLVSDSEAIDARSAESVYEELTGLFRERGIQVGLVHGAMKQADKESVMRDFAQGRIQVLVATVVIEVGIDVPAATIMVIENAERFGLAQLHQLRGRVGRGAEQSYCFLVSDTEQKISRERLEIMTKTNDGFAAADKDLQMRGPGDFFGTRQHGLPELKMADLVKNADILAAVSQDLSKLMEEDPDLQDPENQLLKKAAEALYGDRNGSNLGI